MDAQKLFKAADKMDWATVRQMIEANPELVNATEKSGDTILHKAIGEPELVVWLLERGADVNATGFNAYTPLHQAGIVGATVTAGILLAHGAEVNARDVRGATPLYWVEYFLSRSPSDEAWVRRLQQTAGVLRGLGGINSGPEKLPEASTGCAALFLLLGVIITAGIAFGCFVTMG